MGWKEDEERAYRTSDDMVEGDRGVRPGISQYPYPSSDHHLPEPQ